MIIPALLIHILGRFIPAWIFKGSDDKPQISWVQVFSKLSGSITSLFVALVLICIITLTTQEKYLLNEHAIYGIVSSPIVKELGFLDGDKIISIQGQPVEKFSDILPYIILNDANTVNVKVQRGETEITIPINTAAKKKLIENSSEEHFFPKQPPVSDTNTTLNELIYSLARRNLSDAIQNYGFMVKQVKQMIVPTIPGFQYVTISKITNLKSALFGLSMTLVFVGLICMLPLPGLDMGNALIALIEKLRNRKFNLRIIKTIRIICLSLITIVALVILYLN